MNDKRVLLVCYYFPPLGGAGVGRPLSLFRYLPDHGIECDVLTVKPVAYRFYEPELLDGLEKRKIYRSGSRDPQRLMYLLGLRQVKDATIAKGKAVADRFFPDPKAGWVRPAVKLGRVLAENRHYRCVISTSPPMSSHLVARQLATEFNIPWIADFRDFWTGYKAEDWFADPKQVAKARQLIGQLTAAARAVTVVNPAIAEYLKTGTVIYNSYDENRAKLWRPPGRNDKFVIGVLGTIDDLRPVEPLFRLVARIREHNSETASRLKLLQVGNINDPEFDSLVERYGVRDIIEINHFQNRERTIELMSETAALYIGLASPLGHGVLPGRLFDMIASGRPIMAAVPSGGVVDRLISETGCGCSFGVDDLDRAVDYLVERADRFRRGELAIEPLPEYSKRFSSARMTEEFARLIEAVGRRDDSSSQ